MKKAEELTTRALVLESLFEVMMRVPLMATGRERFEELFKELYKRIKEEEKNDTSK